MSLDEKLARLKAAREREANAKAEAEELRDEILEDLDVDEAPVYFIDENGVKQYGYYSETPEYLIDIQLLRELVPELADELIDVREEVDRTAFETAHRTGRLPNSVVQQVLRRRVKSRTIRFGKPDDA